jgi:flagellin
MARRSGPRWREPGPGRASASAFAIAAAINAAAAPGISASAANSLSGTASGAGNIANGGLTVNGIAIGPISGGNAAALAASAAAAFTAVAGASGVTASASGSSLRLASSDGRNIVLSEALAGNAALLGLGTGAHHGTINLVNVEQVAGSRVDIGGNNPGAAGLAGGAYNATPTGRTQQVLVNGGEGGEPALDISSVTGANQALDYIDAKIEHSNTIRSALGALQNRLERVYTSILDNTTTLAAARARIRDADFASETAQLTRSQILQQASSAILAQANSLPNQTLALLR